METFERCLPPFLLRNIWLKQKFLFAIFQSHRCPVEINDILKISLFHMGGDLFLKLENYAVQSTWGKVCEWQSRHQHKHLHQYWNSQNRDSLRVTDATGSTDKGQRTQSISHRHQFHYLFWPSTQGLFFWAQPKSGRLTDGKSIRRSRILRSAVGRENREDLYSEVRVLEKNNRHCWNEDAIRVIEWEMSAEHQFTQRYINESMKKGKD